MYHISETRKSVKQTIADLEAAVKRNGFGVLHIHDLGATLRGKGIAFGEECSVLEICNPVHASRVMSTDMNLNMALPCRVSVFTEGGKTKIGFITPVRMLSALSSDPALRQIAEEVETAMIRMVEETK